MSATKVAVVTGSNKGIGFATVKGLCEKFQGVVYLTARNQRRGEEAVKKLNELGLKPAFHQLDVDDIESVKTFRDYLVKKHGGLDVLINNAAIATSTISTELSDYEKAKLIIQTNYHNLKTICDLFIPILRENGRIVNVSSSLGHSSVVPDDALKKQLRSEHLTISELDKITENYLQLVQENKHEPLWGKSSSYAISKVFASALTRIQQRLADQAEPKKNLCINHVHPGYVNTDMTMGKGPLTIEEGAVSSIAAAMDDNKWKGEFIWKDGKVVDWTADQLPEAY